MDRTLLASIAAIGFTILTIILFVARRKHPNLDIAAIISAVASVVAVIVAIVAIPTSTPPPGTIPSSTTVELATKKPTDERTPETPGVNTPTPTPKTTDTPTPPPDPATASTGLHFVMSEAETYGFYRLHSGEPKAVVTGMEEQLGPFAVSLDGQWVAMAVRTGDGSRSLRLLDMRDREWDLVIPDSRDPYGVWPTWRTLNEGEVTFSLSKSQDTSLRSWTVGDAASRSFAVGVSADSAGQPDWSPDGTLLALVGWRGDEATLWIWDEAQHIGSAVVSSQGLHHRHPSWSPDGSQLTTECTSIDDKNGVCVIDLDTGQDRLVFQTSNPNTKAWRPLWSPDGHWIAFVSDYLSSDTSAWDGLSGEVYIQRIDDTRPTQITDTGGRVYAWGIDWGPP